MALAHAAFDWYLQRSPDAARKLDAEFERALAEIAQAPQRWARGSYHTRRFLLRKFPFLLIYRERADGDLQIVAVAAYQPEARILERADLSLKLKIEITNSSADRERPECPRIFETRAPRGTAPWNPTHRKERDEWGTRLQRRARSV